MAQTFQKVFPARFVECYIAEQNMVGVALGLSKRGYIPFVSAFGAFFSRAFDHIRMTSISQGNVKFVGSHAGVSIGEDGASQMALEDLAMFRAIMNSVVLYPSDAYSTYRALEIAANHQGIVYIRTGRPAASLLYTPTDTFQLGKLKVLHQSATDIVTVVAAGVTITEALKAYETLNSSGQHIRVVDLFSVKPVDEEGLVANARETMGRIVTVEDHLLDGGIFDAVASAVAKHGIKVYGLGVNTPPHSGTCDELLDLCGISAAKIIDKIKHL
jgi:transketolase